MLNGHFFQFLEAFLYSAWGTVGTQAVGNRDIVNCNTVFGEDRKEEILVGRTFLNERRLASFGQLDTNQRQEKVRGE